VQVRCENWRLNLQTSMETERLESGRGEWNSWCSGEMRRYQEEHPWRRRLSGTVLTLRRESVGSEQDETYLVLSGGNASALNRLYR